jgi:CRP-like cAMP-binding protein
MTVTPCALCPLRPLPLFVAHTSEELMLVQGLKRRELVLHAGDTLIHEGEADTRLYTLLRGWGYRFKTLSDGRRQILNFLLAGDFIGVQQKMSDAAAHGVVMVTEATLCVFDRNALWELHRSQPSMGFNITWLTAHEESLVDDNLLSIGRRSAEERVATMLMLLYKRALALHQQGETVLPPVPGNDLKAPTVASAEPPLSAGPGVPFPLTQQHIADALGLSLAHTNKTLRKLQRRGLYRIEDGRLQLLDPKALARLADLWGDGRPPARPLV